VGIEEVFKSAAKTSGELAKQVSGATRPAATMVNNVLEQEVQNVRAMQSRRVCDKVADGINSTRESIKGTGRATSLCGQEPQRFIWNNIEGDMKLPGKSGPHQPQTVVF
jgi:hypothetical protein